MLLNRRSSSNSSKNKERRELATSKDDINNCSICQYALVDLDVIQLRPCRHNFHKDCINELTKYDPGVKSKNVLIRYKLLNCASKFMVVLVYVAGSLS